MRGGANPEKSRPRGVGVVGRGGEKARLPVEIRFDTSKFCLNWLRSKAPINCKKRLLTFSKVQNCKGGEEGSSTVGGIKAATSTSSSKNSGSSNPQQEHKNKKSSNKQQKQEQHKQHKQQPRKSEGQEVWVPKVGGWRLPWNFGKIAIIGH